jgi:RHS repeat-associated protein
MSWSADGSNHSYSFTYDGANRLLDAIHGTGAYTEKVNGYDRNGNILGLQRYGNGLIDNLTYSYDGNRLTQVEDVTGNSAGFNNGASAANEYTYDYNGNLTKDSNKGISNISWNSLNLPNVVSFSDGSTVTYTYAADGTKLRTVHNINGAATQKDYCGSVVYENGVQKILLTEEDYVDLTESTPAYYYYLKDHQGNNRVVINSSGAVQETNHYYPFGGVFASTGNVQPYKYNGKELDTKKGLNWYDYGARHYDAALGRWFVVDPLAEKYYSTSVYGYCLNNPVKYIDADGRKIVIGTPMQRLLGKLGLDSYVENVSKQLKQNNMDSRRIQSVYNQIEESEHVYRILPLSESPYGEGFGNHVIPVYKTERGKNKEQRCIMTPI